MRDYLTLTDIQLLREHGFTVGAFGESWFGVDKDGSQWQAYAMPHEDRLTFVGPDRASRYMEREEFTKSFTKE